jgi:capsular exopolysaccharide synthesis family protein
MNTNQYQQQQSLKDIDFIYYIRHYLKLFWKWRIYLIIAVPVTGIIAGFGVIKAGLLRNPPLTVTSAIGLESQLSKSLDEFNGSGQNKERLILNHRFLNDIVSKLSLQLVVNEYSRYQIFDSVSIDSTAPLGTFKFKLNNKQLDNYTFLYTNKKAKIVNKVIESGSVASLEKLTISGMHLQFSKTFLKAPHNFSFSISDQRLAIDRLSTKLRVTSPNIREDKYFFLIVLEGSDYPLITLTVNTIADYFIQQSTEIKKKRINNSLGELEKQLVAAEQQLSLSKSNLKAFLAKNPAIGLSQSTQQTMSDLISLETGSYESNSLVEEAISLKEKWKNVTTDDKIPILNEIIVFLQTRGSIAAPSLQLGLTQTLADKESATQNYAKSHPIFLEIDNKLNALYSRALLALDTYINQQKKIIADRNYSIQKMTSKLQALPSQELQLAEFQKRQDIDNDIYSKLLSKYNEAKVAETVESPGVYIMEYAIQPIEPSSFQQLLKCLFIVFASVLLVGFGPAVVFDMIDKTAKSEQALSKLLQYRFLESIPKITMPKLTVKEKNAKKILYEGEVLINTPGILPASAVELFRSLTTKIQLDYFNNPEKTLVVTSLEMNEGKSTISANLAISFAEYGVKTVLIDCDLRRGVTHKILGIKKVPGLSDYLSSVLENSPIQLPLFETGIKNLSIIPSGNLSDNPQKLLQSLALADLKNKLLQDNYFIIFDSPPIAVTADSAILSNIASKYLLVIRSGVTNVIHLRKIIHKDYPMLSSKIIGTVLNMSEDNIPKNYYGYYLNNPRISKSVS